MQKLCKNLNIIFIGVSSQDSEPLIALLRASRLAPREKLANTECELTELLKERASDILIYAQGAELQFTQVKQLLKSNNKDMPTVILAPDYSPQHAIAGLKDQASAVVPIEAKELLAITIRRELYHLENRRRRRKAELNLIEVEKQCRKLLTSSTNATAYLNKDLQFIFANPAFMELTGYSNSTDILGLSIFDLVPRKHQKQLDTVIEQFQHNGADQDSDTAINRKDGSEFYGTIALSRSRFERTLCTQITLSPLESHPEIDRLTEQDLVTGLKNKIYFNKQLDKTVKNAARGQQDANLLYITLDNFDATKAEVGITGINAIAFATAELLQSKLIPAHELARVEADSFCIIYADGDSSKAKSLAEEIRVEIETKAIQLDSTRVHCTASIGIIPITQETISAQEALQFVRTASESVRSKNQRGNGVNLYIPDSKSDDEAISVKKLREAIKNNQLKLLFQPVVSLQGENDNIYEVLLRLIDNEHNEVSPNMFLTMLDHAEVSLELDRWVIGESIRQLAEQRTHNRTNRLFINITGRSLGDGSLLPWISDQLKIHQVPGDSIIFQFSESDASAYLKYANVFAQSLEHLNADICIKHYGSSIDSDNVLRHVPAAYVKLDGSFVQELQEPEKHDAFDKLIEPLKTNKKVIIAPLVEGTNVMSKLWQSGVNYIQGFYLQAPRERMDYDFFNES